MAVLETCVCREALRRSFATVREAVYSAKDMDPILANAELVAQSDEKWMRLYRCRACGTEWTKACYSSGHMEIYYLFPAPSAGDTIRWLHEEATELPPA
jgi:hypothetical protein